MNNTSDSDSVIIREISVRITSNVFTYVIYVLLSYYYVNKVVNICEEFFINTYSKSRV